MPSISAHKIHDEIVSALQESIIPTLQTQQVPLGCVAPPFDFPSGIKATLQSKRVPRADTQKPGYPLVNCWSKHEIHAAITNFFGVIYRGEADDHTIVTAKQAAKHNISKGIYSLHWSAPGVLLFPPFAPRNRGNRSIFWDSTNPLPGHTKIFWVEKSENSVLIHIFTMKEDGFRESSHSLNIKDTTFNGLTHLFCESLRNTPKNTEATQAILLAALLRLRDYLQTTRPKIANTSRPPIASQETVSDSGPSKLVWEEAAVFIQMNLRERLTLPLIAGQVSISKPHLNRLFHRFSGMSVMRYVRQQRIKAAQDILLLSEQSIQEIAFLVGFNSASAFCTVFLRETGQSPNQFRRQSLHKSTF